MIISCKKCNCNFNKLPSQIKRTKNNFCSKSCAASFNNKAAHKRKLSNKCKKCDSLIRSDVKYCKKHKNCRRANGQSYTKWSQRSTEYKLANNLRTRINASIRNGSKAGSAVKSLGCSINELKVYLESKFLDGMSWDNWSRTGWHIDHIIPLSSFDLTDIDQLKAACHFTNLQPLWAKDNLIKGNR